jgi:hypothetical protein
LSIFRQITVDSPSFSHMSSGLSDFEGWIVFC